MGFAVRRTAADNHSSRASNRDDRLPLIPCQKSNSKPSWKAKRDSAPKEKLQSAIDAETVVAIAKEAGFISADELKNAGSANLSDQEWMA